jgi:hypothetical protein
VPNEFEMLQRVAGDADLRRGLLDGTKTPMDIGVSEESAGQFLAIVGILDGGLWAASLGGRRATEEQWDSTARLWTAFKESLMDTVGQIKGGFFLTMLMYNVTFYLGVALVVASVVFAFAYRESLLSLGLGGLGTVNLVAFLIIGPAERLERSRAGLAQLNAALYTWVIDNYNWNMFNAAQAPGQMTFDQAKAISDMMLRNTQRTMKMLQEYCKQVPEAAAVMARTAETVLETATPEPASA